MPKARIPPIANLESLDGTIGRRRITNGYAEPTANGARTFKRPGMTLVDVDLAGFGQGMFYDYISGTLYYVTGPYLYSWNGSTASQIGQVATPATSHTLTAGTSGGLIGYSSGSYGTLDPLYYISGSDLIELIADVNPGLSVSINGLTAAPAQDYFGFISINSQIYLTSAASYSPSGISATWTWTTPDPALVNTTVYNVAMG